jgi:hypothetical protein
VTAFRKTLFFLSLAIASPAMAAFVPDPALRMVDLPPRTSEPIAVQVDFYLLDVTAVNGSEESFNAALYFNFSWKDPRMAFDAATFGADRVLFTGDKSQDQLQDMWSPEIYAANLVGDGTVNEPILTIFSDGRVTYEARVSGTFKTPMQLRRFPFDEQALQIQIESAFWDASEVKLFERDGESYFNTTPSVSDWTLKSVRSSVSPVRYPTGESYSRFTAEMTMQRKSWFYMWSVVLPLAMVTFFAVSSFFLDQETVSERVAQALTCLLTVAAQSVAVSADLPKISYFTLIDYAFLLTYAALLVVALESIAVNNLHRRNGPLAERVDLTCSWVVSLSYTLGLVGIFVFVR